MFVCGEVVDGFRLKKQQNKDSGGPMEEGGWKLQGHGTYSWAQKRRLRWLETNKIKLSAPFNVLDGERFPSQEDKNKFNTSKRKIGWLCRQGPSLDDGRISVGWSIQNFIWECPVIQFFQFLQSIKFRGLSHIDQSHKKQNINQNACVWICHKKYTCLQTEMLMSIGQFTPFPIKQSTGEDKCQWD